MQKELTQVDQQLYSSVREVVGLNWPGLEIPITTTLITKGALLRSREMFDGDSLSFSTTSMNDPVASREIALLTEKTEIDRDAMVKFDVNVILPAPTATQPSVITIDHINNIVRIAGVMLSNFRIIHESNGIRLAFTLNSSRLGPYLVPQAPILLPATSIVQSNPNTSLMRIPADSDASSSASRLQKATRVFRKTIRTVAWDIPSTVLHYFSGEDAYKKFLRTEEARVLFGAGDDEPARASRPKRSYGASRPGKEQEITPDDIEYKRREGESEYKRAKRS